MLTEKKYPINPHFITNDKGEKESVVLSMSEYSYLLEELNDLAVIAERRNDPSVSHSDFLRELKQDGYI